MTDGPIEEPPAPDIQQLRQDCNHGLTHVEYPSPDPDDATKVYICEECGQQLSGGRYLPAADPLIDRLIRRAEGR